MNRETESKLNEILDKLNDIVELLTEKFPQTKPIPEYGMIAHIARGVTRNSGQPKWACTLRDNRQLWIIQHSNPDRDSTGVWRKYGFIWTALEAMAEGDTIDCRENPLEIEMVKDGDFWKVTKIMRDPFALWVVDIDHAWDMDDSGFDPYLDDKR